jgi:hypothetical protein
MSTCVWTAIGTVLAFVLLLFLGESILAFAAEQLRERRAHRLDLERERTKQALIGHDRDALIWRQLEGAAECSDHAPEPR